MGVSRTGEAIDHQQIDIRLYPVSQSSHGKAIYNGMALVVGQDGNHAAVHENAQRAHSSQLAAELASELQ